MRGKYNITDRIKYLIANIESDLKQIKECLPKLSETIDIYSEQDQRDKDSNVPS